MSSNDWTIKLALFFEEKRTQQFNWRENNCCFFACDWIAIRKGFDPAARFRNVPARVLARFVRERPLSETIDAACLKYGFAPVPLAFAQRGDLIETMEHGAPALGVCNGRLSGFPGQEGLVFVATLKCNRAWRIK